MSFNASEFVDPPWGAALAIEPAIASIPQEATISGMFYLALQEGAKRHNLPLTLPQERYLPYNFYPAREFARALVQAAQVFHPDRSLRQGLRALGAAAPKAFANSTLGKVTLGSAEGVHAVVTAMAKNYETNVRPSRCSVLESAPRRMRLLLEKMYYFVDSHHVGVFEGTLERAGVRGRVRIASRGRVAAELLLEW
ncbi:MAG: DUF2378 family protein [Polyangiaceae bacterium]